MITGILMNNIDGIELNETAIKAPILYGGKPIGFIDNVVKGEDDKISAFTFVLWSKDAVVELTEEGNVAGIELNDAENKEFKLLY